ncbi:MAG: hypothetical protein PHZ11_02425 [Desulfitobacteriaceae bacterium]|nr:hypothetical protein [Desulfitobacteriaceae bacterium]MDD4345751.1 hypothetical protein [Desulfitobacteriaceae bacterium]MDD4400956.1 hypothetical protein [Desulfitobacteriaceae bacterium]
MEIDVDLIKRAQMLTFMENSLSEVEEILLREGYPENQVKTYIGSTEAALDSLMPDRTKIDHQLVDKGYDYKTKLEKIIGLKK